jgi:hypothetical protein
VCVTVRPLGSMPLKSCRRCVTVCLCPDGLYGGESEREREREEKRERKSGIVVFAGLPACLPARPAPAHSLTIRTCLTAACTCPHPPNSSSHSTTDGTLCTVSTIFPSLLLSLSRCLSHARVSHTPNPPAPHTHAFTHSHTHAHTHTHTHSRMPVDPSLLLLLLPPPTSLNFRTLHFSHHSQPRDLGRK